MIIIRDIESSVEEEIVRGLFGKYAEEEAGPLVCLCETASGIIAFAVSGDVLTLSPIR